MRVFSDLAFRLRALLRGKRMETELDDELRYHLEKETEKLVAAGFEPRAARREAQRRFGSYRRQRDNVLWSWGMSWRHGLGTDLRVIGRQMRRTPGFTIVAVVTLALGLGGSAAIFTLLDRVVFDPLPYPDAERLVYVDNLVAAVDSRFAMSAAQYVYMSENAQTFEAVGLYQGYGTNIETFDGPRRTRVMRVTAEVLPLLGARAHLGRLIAPEDDRPGSPRVVVLSYDFWQRFFGGDVEVLGSTLSLSTVAAEIIGVAGPGLRPPSPTPRRPIDIWTAQRIDPEGVFRNSHNLPMIGRLATGATIDAARAEIAHLTTQLPERFPLAYDKEFFEQYGFETQITPLKEYVVGEISRSLWILFGAVGLVLLIAAANVTNLFLVRMDGRRRELSIRSALGAGRSAIARYVLAESLLVSLAGGVLALLVGHWGVPALVALAPNTLPRMDALGLSPGSVAFTLTLAILLGLTIAASPLASFGGAVGALSLVDGGRSMSVGIVRQRLRGGLVIVQVALALTLVAAAGLLIESMRRLGSLDGGMEPEGVLTAGLFLTRQRYQDDTELWTAYREMLDGIRAIPGVSEAGMTGELPVLGGFGCTVQGFEDASVQDRIVAAGATLCAGQAPTTPGYFEALGIPVLMGRSFTEADNDAPAAGAVIVSRAFADRFWPGENPLGKGVAPGGRDIEPFYHVVGVVGDVPAGSLDGASALAIYYPISNHPDTPENWGWWMPTNMNLVVKTQIGDPFALVPEIRRAVESVDPSIPLANVRSMEDIMSASTSRFRFASVLLGIAAAVALLLAAVGLYGVVSYIVGRRTREIGIRIAIGARPRDVSAEVIRRSLGLVAGGLAIGLVLAFSTTRLLRGLLYGVEPTHPVTFLVAAGTLASIAVVASWIPARRAARVDPVEALRAD